jgi:hypothetical protein
MMIKNNGYSITWDGERTGVIRKHVTVQKIREIFFRLAILCAVV